MGDAMGDDAVVTIGSIRAAAGRLQGQATVTPVISSPVLDEIAGGPVLVKAECLQRTGSFKFRGAWNMISRLDGVANPGGVVAYSSGNHAQGVAAAAAIKGLKALIVMPQDTPQLKVDNTRGHGAEIVFYDRASGDRNKIARDLAAERSAVLVPPFDHAHIIAGQGTAGLEFLEQVRGRGVQFDQVLVCTGGGGLTAGIAVAMEAMSRATKVYSVEPEGFDDHARSLRCGHRVANAARSGSICDALLSPEPGEVTFALNQPRLAGGFAVSDDEVRAAMVFAFEHLKLVAEPGGAVALAAVLAGKVATAGKTTGVIISGGNVDAGLFAEVLRGAG